MVAVLLVKSMITSQPQIVLKFLGTARPLSARRLSTRLSPGVQIDYGRERSDMIFEIVSADTVQGNFAVAFH
jgi:hypothetical protein